MRRVFALRPHVVLVAAAILFCLSLLLAGEWIVRAAGPDRLRLSPARSPIVHSSLYGWQLRRNWTHRDAQGRMVSTNAARRRALPQRAPGSDAPRLALLGDSVAFGAGVDDVETFANLLSREGWAVANFAVPGWGIDQSLLRYEHEARGWRPTVVVLNVCLANDLADSMLANYLYDPAWPKPYFTLEHGRLRQHGDHLVRSKGRRTWLWLWENVHLLSLLAPAAPYERPDDAGWMGRRRVAVRDDAAAAGLAVRVVQRLQDSVRRDGSTLLVVLHPDRAAFEERSKPSAVLQDLLGAAGVPTLDLGARYREEGWTFPALMLDGLGHLSPRGHAVAAELIQQAALSDERIVRPGLASVD